MNEALMDKWKQRAAAAQSNRETMPIVSEFVDEMRRLFGSVTVTYASENGVERGQRSTPA